MSLFKQWPNGLQPFYYRLRRSTQAMSIYKRRRDAATHSKSIAMWDDRLTAEWDKFDTASIELQNQISANSQQPNPTSIRKSK